MSNWENKAFLFLRLSLGLMFLWFGVLKLFASGDGLSILQASLPTGLAFSQLFSFFIAFLEITLGLAFLSGKFVKTASITGFVYLLTTAVLIVLTQGFDPRFPVLSAAGESALKNLVLAGSCLILLTGKRKEPQTVKSDSV